MTRQYAAIQLLRHGPLSSREFLDITGWPYRGTIEVMRKLRKRGIIQNLPHNRDGHSVYALRTGDYL